VAADEVWVVEDELVGEAGEYVVAREVRVGFQVLNTALLVLG
jgi:hypothetical protein